MSLPDARAALESYDLDVASIDALAAGSVNSNFSVHTRSGERFFLRVYEEQGFDGAAVELAMIRELAESGVPTPPPRARRDGSYVGAHGGKPIGVHAWVDGASLGFRSLEPRIVRRVGGALARVHRCSPLTTPIPAGRFGVEGLRERLDRVDRTDASYASVTRRIRGRLEHYVASAPSGLPSGLIHGDLFRDNVLWALPPTPGADAEAAAPELVALLDFESASAGVFVYDLMVCVHAWCYGDRFDVALVRAMIDGYRQERPLSAAELAALAPQGALAALRFATTRLTDFSLRAPPGQAPARDYRRFLARLDALENGLLSPIIEEGAS
jgi:homoserine kinase type II